MEEAEPQRKIIDMDSQIEMEEIPEEVKTMFNIIKDTFLKEAVRSVDESKMPHTLIHQFYLDRKVSDKELGVIKEVQEKYKRLGTPFHNEVEVYEPHLIKL